MTRVLVRGQERVEVTEPDLSGDTMAYAERLRRLVASGFRDEVPASEHFTFHASGEVAVAGPRDDGVVSHFDPRGLLSARGRREGGQRVGLWRFYHPHGGLRLLERYGDPIQSLHLWPSGRPQARGASVASGDGYRRVGTWTHWERDGSVSQTAHYDPEVAQVQSWAEGSQVESGAFAQGLDGEVRHGSFRTPQGVQHWDLGVRVAHEADAVDLRERLARVEPHDRPALLREVLHAEPEQLAAYLELQREGAGEAPEPEARLLEGCPPDLAAEAVASAVYARSSARGRNLLKALAPACGDLAGALVAAYDAEAPGRSAALRWLLEASDARAEPVFVKALEDAKKPVRDVAARGIAASPNARDLWILALSSARAPARRSAAEGLSRLGDPTVSAAIEDALADERSKKVKTALESALGSLALARGDVSDEALDRALAARGGTSIWETPVRFRTGAPLSAEARRWLGDALTRESAKVQDRELWNLRRRLDDDDCASLLGEIMAAVAPGERPEADASVEETRKTPAWALYAHAVLGDDAAMGRLGRSLQDLVYLRSPAWAGHGVEALRRNPRPSALRWLAFWSRKAGTGKLLSDSAAALTALREELGLDADDVADLFLPTLGLDPAGERDLGAGCRAVLVDGAFELQRDDPTKPVPRKVQRNFDKLVSSLPRAREVAWNQLEAAMILERAWPRERWDALFGHNPLLREGMEHLLVVSEAEVLPAGRLPSGSGAVRVLHPLEAASATRAQWVHLTPPFPQLSRALEADVEAALASVAAEFETPIRGRVGKSVTFVVDGDGVQVDGRPMTEKILQEILCVCRSA